VPAQLTTAFLTCVVCGKGFVRPGSRGPVPKYCSPECSREPRKEAKREYDHRYYHEVERATPERLEARRAYQHDYNRRPEVRAKGRERGRQRWADPHQRRQEQRRNREYHQREEVRERINAARRERYAADPEYRAEQIARANERRNQRPYFEPTPLPAPYSGHRWLEMAREAVVRGRDLDPSTPWADDYFDEMGEAVLALLEGRDMAEAVHDYRRKEFVPRRLTQHLSDYVNEDGNSWFDTILPPEPSAEEQAVLNETFRPYLRARHRKPSQKRASRHMDTGKTGQPSNRRSNNKGLADHRRGAFVRGVAA
jgi:hypothetical protein